MQKHLIFVAISVLVVAFAIISYLGFEAFAVPRDPNYVPNEKCMPNMDGTRLTCCWDEPDILNPGEFIHWCQSCDFDGGNCGEVFSQSPQPTGPFAPPQDGVLEQPPAPPSDPAAPLQDGEVLQQPPGEGVAPPPTRGQGVLPEDGVLQQPPADEGTGAAPRTVEPPTSDEATQPPPETLPGCPEGQVLDEESGLCVQEEPEAEEPEQAQSDEEEQSAEGDGSADNNSND